MNTIIMRPWGWYKTAYQAKDIEIQELAIKPDNTTELTRRLNGTISWVVLAGECNIELEDGTLTIKQHEHYLLPQGQWFKISNCTDELAKVLEIVYHS